MRQIYTLSNQFTIGAIIEGWFMQNVILPPQSVCLEWDLEKFRDAVVIYHQLGQPNLQTIETLKKHGNRVVLLHMGDEHGEHERADAYREVDLILRNYFFKAIFDDPTLTGKIIWVPNGYKNGVGPREAAGLRKASERRFLAAFLGWIDNTRSYKNERYLLKEIAPSCKENLIMHATQSFANGFNSGLYSAIMEYSVFCACPAGNSPETIRLYDALEVGCLPISLHHEFLYSPHALGGVPFPVLDEWGQLPEFLEQFRLRFTQSPEELLLLQQASLSWWTGFKHSLRNRIQQRLLELAR
jgi:hypothetical protein